MSDDKEIAESAEVPPEQELPTPTFGSGQEPDSQVSQSSVATDVMAQLLNRLDRIERQQQSVKDKRLSDFEKRLNEFTSTRRPAAEVLSEYDYLIMEKKVDPEVAKLIVTQKEQLIDAQSQREVATPPNKGMLDAKQASDNALKRLAEVGLTVDAEFVALNSKRYNNIAEYELAVERHINNKKFKPTPSPAAVSAPPPAPTPKVNGEALAAEFEKLSKEPTKNAARMQQIKKQLREAGVWS